MQNEMRDLMNEFEEKTMKKYMVTKEMMEIGREAMHKARENNGKMPMHEIYGLFLKDVSEGLAGINIEATEGIILNLGNALEEDQIFKNAIYDEYQAKAEKLYE